MAIRVPTQLKVEAEHNGAVRCRHGSTVFYIAPTVPMASKLARGKTPQGESRIVFGPSELAVIAQACEVYSGDQLDAWLSDAVMFKTIGGRVEGIIDADLSDDDNIV